MNLTAIIIIAIICSAIVSIIKTYKKSDQSNKLSKDHMRQYESHIEQKLDAMQERIEVLEKIVTDEKYNLNKAFSDLKD
jgi:phage shock protein B